MPVPTVSLAIFSVMLMTSLGQAGVASATVESEPDYDSQAPAKALIFSSPDGTIMPDTDVNCIALTNIARAVSASCSLFGPEGSGCGFGGSAAQPACASTNSSDPIAPPTFSPAPAECRPHCKEFDMLITGSSFSMPGQWHLVISFYDFHGKLIEVHPPSRAITVLSIFVLPESQVGTIALIGTSMSALGAVYYFKKRQMGTGGIKSS